MKKKIFARLALLAVALTGASIVHANGQIVAVNYPPLMIESVESPGWALEIIGEAERRIGRDSPVQFLPFPRAIKTVQRRAQTMHPALYRNPTREHKFTWIAKVHVVNNVFLTVGSPIDSLEAARKLGKIGVEVKTAMDDFLTSRGFTNLERAERAELNARKLAAGRIDAWFLTDTLALWAWKQAGMKRRLVIGKPISSSDVYIVGGKNFPPDTLSEMRGAIQAMRSDGTIERLIGRYQ